MPNDLDAIRARAEAIIADRPAYPEPARKLAARDVPALVAEVERLHREVHDIRNEAQSLASRLGLAAMELAAERAVIAEIAAAKGVSEAGLRAWARPIVEDATHAE